MIPLLCLFLVQAEIKTRLLSEYTGRKLTVGDPFEIVVELTYPQSATISEPFPDSLPPFSVLGMTSKVVQQKGSVSSIYRIRLAAFQAGDLSIPVFRAIYQPASARPETLQSAAVPIKIASVLPGDMKDINDVKKMYEFPNILPFIILVGAIGLAVASFFGYRLYQRLKKARRQTCPALPAWDEALQSIDELLRQDLVGQGLIKRYYYALSEILKRYLERRFAFNAVEQTTTEIVAAMRQQKTPLRDDFSRFFSGADMVKYAKHIPRNEDISGAADQVKGLIVRTKPEEKPVEPA